MERDARDRIAEMVVGWKPPINRGSRLVQEDNKRPTAVYFETFQDGPQHGPNPIPASLDFVSAAWPDGVNWWKNSDNRDWMATSKRLRECIAFTTDTGSALADFTELLARTLEWLRDNDPPAFAAACEKVRKAMEEHR